MARPSRATWTGMPHVGQITCAAPRLPWKVSQMKRSRGCVLADVPRIVLNARHVFLNGLLRHN
eukprot:973369-Prymnesium_polylepis.1